jgi:hypothetical protein
MLSLSIFVDLQRSRCLEIGTGRGLCPAVKESLKNVDGSLSVAAVVRVSGGRRWVPVHSLPRVGW